ncbi:putative peptidase M16 family protein [Lyophyllum shimeji]|uniref:Peptidase M16 family protein n=1 Tax=Lyophyllum shimeji TaxID=47721 RepID=A0A9P3UIS0_LYOSH|nr:putative peptidase M16 family protein [Lyophyllum shimeji]
MATVAGNDTEWRRVATAGTVPPYSVFTKPIQKSEQDDRDYRIIQLSNGLQATLVHDAKADRAAASLDVAVGHLYDPDDMPGLAHFCEHLLFMGTEQFPRENEYSEYLAKNNGASNAYTSTSNTNYYFSVGTHALPGALERFAAFFHSPLFSPSCTSRELNAVDSEHKKNHQADMWRIFQLNKHLSKKGHVWSKFGSGNRESLSKAAKDLKAKGLLTESGILSRPPSVAPSPIPSRIASPAPSVASTSSESEADGGAVGRETRRRLVEWWSKEYCASRMRLCIVGKESLDELSELAFTLFSSIPNRGRDALPMIHDHPFGPNEKGTLVSVQTIMSFHALEISFPMEYQPPFWKHKPSHFLSHFVGHEGPGSLYSYLKSKGWVTSLNSGPQNLARGFAMFKITVHLTEAGFRHYRDVIHAAFQYLALLRASKFDAFHQHEVAKVSEIRFRFAEKRRPDDYATWIAEHMAWPVPRELLLSAPQVTWDWDSESAEAQVKAYLESFRITEGRVVLMATAAEHAKLAPSDDWQKEPWYGTGYRVDRFDEDFVEKAQASNGIPELFLPGPNEFIPTNLDVEKRTVPEPLKRPHLVRETPLSSLWHKRDDRFFVPKAHVMIDIRSVVGNESPRASVMTKLFADLVNDSLSEYSYDADLAGLSYNFVSHTSGLYVSVNGYNDKLIVLVKNVLGRVKSLTVDPQRLAVMKEQNKREWENFFLGQSYSLSDYFGRYAMTERQWTLEEKLKDLPSVTPEEIEAHAQRLLSQVHLRMLVSGNIHKDEAIKIAEIAEDGLGVSPLSPIELNDRALLLPPASNYTWTCPIPNPNQANSALTYYVHFGPIVDQPVRVTASLLTQILSEPAFNVLRTQEQLGYIVHCSAWSLPGASEKGMRIVIQSEKTPGYLEDRVEAFLDGMKTTIENMTAEEFAEQKHGLEKKWLEKDKNLADETAKFINHINTGHLDFLRKEDDARLLKDITKEDVLKLFLSRVHPSSAVRSKLSIHMISQKPLPKRVSAAASQAFEKLLRQAQVDVEENTRKESLGSDGTPLATDFANYWKQVLASKDNAGKLIDAIPELVEKYPVAGEGKDPARPGVSYVKDLKQFKAGLTPSIDPGPMVHWGDLPVSRF